MIKTSKDFLSLAGLRRGKVKVRGQEVHFRELSVGCRKRLRELATKGETLGATEPVLVAMCVTDENGDLLFKDEQEVLNANVSSDFINAIAGAILDLSGEDDEKNG